MCLTPPVPGDQNLSRGSPLFTRFLKFPGAIALSNWSPIVSLPPPPPCTRRRAWGGWAYTIPATKKFPGVPPWFLDCEFFLASCSGSLDPSHFPAPSPCACRRVWGG